jgi:GxxExxY protein
VEFDALSRQVIGCALQVHSSLGPGLLESTYQRCLAIEMAAQGILFEEQVTLPITYRDIQIDNAFRMDFVVAGELVVEIKAVAELLDVHQAQVLTYMRFSRIHIGLLINFNVAHLKGGIRRFVL